ncbi:hypothetical protein CKA38_02400 [Ereboglobus luteus]|uniref:Uncharacterized protein n=2 Tax=Ereboglobus luteus TaxID=1796921 RepID=A0A2U8E0F9_9BACT|nr:hypothetical protein CKA38_02400 [Ereboglobus luteus]
MVPNRHDSPRHDSHSVAVELLQGSDFPRFRDQIVLRLLRFLAAIPFCLITKMRKGEDAEMLRQFLHDFVSPFFRPSALPRSKCKFILKKPDGVAFLLFSEPFMGELFNSTS